MIIPKNLANYITLSRIILSIFILFTEPLSPIFFAIFIICGITDILDGYIARTYGLSSDLGSKLDSFADISFFLFFLMTISPILTHNHIIFLWIISISLIKIITIIIGFIKYGTLSLIHTYLNKITGLCLIILPFLLLLTSTNIILIILCLIASLASIEELIIIIHSQKLILNCDTIFKIHKD